MGLSREQITKEALKNKYGEEFNDFEYVVDGSSWTVTVSPVNNPEILFDAQICSDGTISWDDYCNAYMGFIIQKQLREDLKTFFPDSFIRVRETKIRWEGKETDFRSLSIEEIIALSSMEGINTAGCYVEIYIDKDIGTAQKYSEEYNYFSNTIDDYIQQKKMIPVIVKFLLVDHDTLVRVKDYFSNDLDEDSNYLGTLGIENFTEGIYYPNQNELGNPPNVIANFKKNSSNYIGNYEEYLRRRKALDNVK